ncbi:MAG: S9 family peptidase [Rhodothermales bacterium]
MKSHFRAAFPRLLALLVGVLPILAAAQTPPAARVDPVELEIHGHVRSDPYFWLRERENPEVIAYLEAENAYLEATMAHTKPLQEVLFEEIRGRIKQDDSSVPYRLDDYFYYTRFEDGKNYPVYARKHGSLEAAEEVLLDVNVLAEGKPFMSARTEISPEHDILAYAADSVGRRFYELKFRDLKTGIELPDEIPSVTGNLVWAEDNRTVFYSRQDTTTLRWHQVWRHELGNPNDVLVYEEPDETFTAFVFKTRSRDFIVIGSSQTLGDEYRIVDARRPTEPLKLFQSRERGLEHSIDHLGGHFFIRTNADGATNFKLMRTPERSTSREHWEEVIPSRSDIFLGSFELFAGHLVLSERKNGLTQMRIIPWDGSGEHYLDFGEPAYLAYFESNPEENTSVLRYGYTSMTTPGSVFDYDMNTREKRLLKQDEVLGGFNSSDYVTERVYAPARDGVQVPISLVYRRDTPLNGSAPLLLYAYGSYGSSTDATFSPARLSLLDRGFVYAIAHVRGGQELGRSWYDDGKLLKKKNTFTDFIDAAEFLAEKGYADRSRIFATGGSAGGLLMGAVMNMRPDLWKGIIAHVPWVDVVTTMLDDSIPLTTSEYDEWGNPNDSTYYSYMLSYSPYDQVERKAYPNLLVTTGLHDSQVQYWEPAKWVAKLRALKTNDNILLLKTNMGSGHGGASARYERYREIALDYAFLLDLAEGGNEGGGE